MSAVEAEALLAARILLREREGAERLMDQEVCVEALVPYSYIAKSLFSTAFLAVPQMMSCREVVESSEECRPGSR